MSGARRNLYLSEGKENAAKQMRLFAIISHKPFLKAAHIFRIER